jgi:CER1-like, C-terminal domain
MTEKKRFVFLAHRVESWNALLDSKLFSHLHVNPNLHWGWIWMAPLYWAVSWVSLFSKKGHEVVDEFEFSGMRSQTILLKNYGWHFLIALLLAGKFKVNFLLKSIKGRILEAVLDAQEENDVVGLGALTKAEWLTKGGRWIVDQLGDKLKVPLVHGDTLTAAVVLKQLDVVRRRYGVNSPIFITGATSKIGRAVILTLAKNEISVKMYTKSQERFEEIKEEARDFSSYISKASSLKDGKDCQVWLTGKSNPSGEKLLRAIPKGAVVMNFSVPNPLGENKVHPRSDLLVVEGGLLAYDPEKTDLSFTMRLRPGLTYACHAGTAVHAFKGWKHHEVDKVDVSLLEETWVASEEIGFFLPALPEVAPEKVGSFWKKLADASATASIAL